MRNPLAHTGSLQERRRRRLVCFRRSRSHVGNEGRLLRDELAETLVSHAQLVELARCSRVVLARAGEQRVELELLRAQPLLQLHNGLRVPGCKLQHAADALHEMPSLREMWLKQQAAKAKAAKDTAAAQRQAARSAAAAQRKAKQAAAEEEEELAEDEE